MRDLASFGAMAHPLTRDTRWKAWFRQPAEARALAKVLQRAVMPVVVISDSQNTVRTMQQIQAGRRTDWRHKDLWEFIASRGHLVQEIRWIRSHLTAEEALKQGFAMQDWEGNREADLLATKGVELHGWDDVGKRSFGDKKKLGQKVQTLSLIHI